MENKHNKNLNQAKSSGISPRPSLTIDYALYWHYLDNSDLTDAQKRDWLDAFWSIIVSFVEMGFDIHPLGQTTDRSHEIGTCEQNVKNRDFIAASNPDVLDYTGKSRSQSDKNNDALQCTSERGSQS